MSVLRIRTTITKRNSYLVYSKDEGIALVVWI